jgi:mannose-1-phosphate guanylyltransferase
MTGNPALTAVILAAGFGTRLRPLSYRVPKPLFPILNRPLLGLILSKLEAAGFKRIAINAHHLAADIKFFIETQVQLNLEIILSYETEILGTGGGLRNLAEFLGEGPFLVINGDILTDLDFAEVYNLHQPDAMATLVLHDYPRFNNVRLAEDGHVAAFGTPPAGPVSSTPPLAFSGIQIVSPRVFNLIPPKKFVNIIDTYRQAITAGETVAGSVQKGFFWQDIGTPQDYLEIHCRLLAGELPGLATFYPEITDPFLGEEVTLGARSTMAGGVCLGPGVHVGAEAYLQKTVIWSNAVIDPGVRLEGCVVGKNVRVSQSAKGGIFQS